MYSIRTMATSAAAAALALLASACSDQPTAPAARAAQAAFTASPSGVTLIPNTVRYRDTGGRPATGRSGSAALYALAMLGSDGNTDLELHARAADFRPDVRGTVSRALVKAFDDEGQVVFTHTAGPGEPLRFAGLARGSRLGVQANVQGIDAHRTDVVEVTEAVKLRPDLKVEAGAADDSVKAGTPVVIGASVYELNGDLGAEADCVLRVDGQQVDQARRIWVDAGGFVNCFFTVTSLAEGTHDVEVRVEGVAPGDWDTANNASSFRLVAVARSVPMSWSASVRTETFARRSASRTTMFSAPRWQESRSENNQSGTTEGVQASGFIGRGFAAPFTVELVETSGGRQLQAAEIFTPYWPSPVICAARMSPAHGTSFFLCSYFGVNSSWQHFRNSGIVTYHSTNFSRTWDGDTGEEIDSYHWNFDGTTGTAPAAGISGDYGLALRIHSGGDVTDVQLQVALQPWQAQYSQPEACSEFGAVEWGFLYRSCYSSEYSGSGEEGWAYGSTF